MRIALFTNTYPPSLNGVANVTHFYRRGLSGRGHEVHVFAPAPKEHDPFEGDPLVHRYPSIPMPGEVDYMLALPTPFSLSIKRKLKGLQFDIVHVQHPAWVGAWGQSWAREEGVPVVSTAHTKYEIYADRTPLPNEWVEPAVRSHVVAHYNRCQVVTTPVQWMRDKLIDNGVRVPVELVPNPVDLGSLGEPRREVTRRHLGLSDEEIVIGYLGRLSPIKNLPLIIDAVALLAERRPEVRLLIVGDGNAMERVRERARRCLGERAILTGSVPHEDVCHYHAAMDIFATASQSETQPLAYTEAMFVGVPVVALATPGAADMIQSGDNGLLVTPESGARGVADAIERLLNKPALIERLRRGGRRFARQRDFPAVSRRLEEVYALAAERLALEKA